MATFARLIAAMLVGTFVTAGASSAETIVETAARWGLIGTWRLDCSVPVSADDSALQYVVRSGNLFHDRDWGDGSDSSPVIALSENGDGGLQITVKFDSLRQTRQWSYVKGADGRIRAVSNRNVDTDEYSIRDGRFTSNGQITPWQTHCR